MNVLLPLESHSSLQLWFALAGGLLSFAAYIPYIIDTSKGQTRPQRASWLIWSVLSAIAFFSQLFEGATISLWFVGAQAIASMLVFMLSIRAGTGSILTGSDAIVLFIAGVGIAIWYLTETAAYALGITISISLLGGVVTATKAWSDPDSETLITWVISFIASVLAILSVGEMDLLLLAYPFYLLILNLLLISAIVFGSSRNRSLLQVSGNRSG